MSYCSNCGAEIGKNKKFCPNCGQLVKEKRKSESLSNTEIEDKELIVEQPKKQLETKTRQPLTDKLTKKHKILIASVVVILLLF